SCSDVTTTTSNSSQPTGRPPSAGPRRASGVEPLPLVHPVGVVALLILLRRVHDPLDDPDYAHDDGAETTGQDRDQKHDQAGLPVAEEGLADAGRDDDYVQTAAQET